MNQGEVAEYFNALADGWDEHPVNGAAIERLLDSARVRAGMSVLDVGCGTGAAIPYYLARSARPITAVDISDRMIAKARKKFAGSGVRFICADAETLALAERFERIVVYNALPHFQDPAALIERLAGLLEPGGVLTVAHGMSRESVNRLHSGPSQRVSAPLMPASSLAEIFSRFLTVETEVSGEDIYQVSGINAQAVRKACAFKNSGFSADLTVCMPEA